jgi:hypothetical protein
MERYTIECINYFLTLIKYFLKFSANNAQIILIQLYRENEKQLFKKII